MPLRDPLGLVGQVLHGQFRVDEVLDDGKRSLLYRGQHLMLEVPIAIKCMKAPPGAGTDAFIRRFRHESRLHYKLSQNTPHVSRVLASGTAVAPTTGALTPFMVLEWMEGKTLADDLAERRARGERGRPLREAVRLLDPAVEALAFAHAHGIVHREVTPDTLFLCDTPEGPRLKVLDFGVAKILSERALDMAPASQSMGLVPIGSPIYAAPEQYSASVGPVGTWTDVYSLALVLLEVMRDLPAFDDSPTPLGLRVLDPKRRPTPRTLGLEVGPNVERILARAVALMTTERPQEAGELWGALKNAILRDEEEMQRVSVPPSTAYPMPLISQPEVPTVSYPSMPATLDAPPMTVRDASPYGATAMAYDELGPPTVEPSTVRREAAVPASSVGEQTAIMPVDEIRRMNELDVDESEPLATRAELFVATNGAMRPPPAAASSGSLVSGRPAVFGFEQSTAVSAGHEREKLLAKAAVLGLGPVPPVPPPDASPEPMVVPGMPAMAAPHPFAGAPSPAMQDHLTRPQSQIQTLPPAAIRSPMASAKKSSGAGPILFALLLFVLGGVAASALYVAYRLKAH